MNLDAAPTFRFNMPMIWNLLDSGQLPVATLTMFEPIAYGPVIPLPSTVWMGLVLLAGIGFFSSRRRKRRTDFTNE